MEGALLGSGSEVGSQDEIVGAIASAGCPRSSIKCLPGPSRGSILATAGPRTSPVSKIDVSSGFCDADISNSYRQTPGDEQVASEASAQSPPGQQSPLLSPSPAPSPSPAIGVVQSTSAVPGLNSRLSPEAAAYVRLLESVGVVENGVFRAPTTVKQLESIYPFWINGASRPRDMSGA